MEVASEVIAYFLRSGTGCSEAEFISHYGDAAYRQIALEAVGCKFVSTVWLGCNLGALPGDAAAQRLVFGTCVLPDGDETRYATEAEAVVGHKRVVEIVRAAP